MQRRSIVIAGLLGALAIAVLGAVLLVGSNGDNGQTVEATALVGSATPPSPSVTALPSGSEGEASGIALVEVEGLLQFSTQPETPEAAGQGLYFLDIETGALEGWYPLIGDTFLRAASGFGRFTVFEREEPTFTGGVQYAAGQYLADRETRKVYRWEGDARLVMQRQSNFDYKLAAQGDLVLFRIPVAEEDDWFSLFNVTTGDVKAVFQAEAEWGLISEDGSQIAMASSDDSPDLFVVDVASGVVTPIGEAALEFLDLEGTIELIDAGDGETFLFAANPAKTRFSGIAVRYTWEGDLVSQVTGSNVLVSHRGDYAAVTERFPVDGDELANPWEVFNAYDMADASPIFRVVGVTPYLGFWGGNRWLADGSGLVVRKPDHELAVAMRDGSLRPFVGMPSPDSTDVFGTYGAAVDAAGTPIVMVEFEGRVRDLVNPWGETGDEIRLYIPRGGHGGPGLTASIVEPYVEEPPYGDLQLQLSDEGVANELVGLRDEAGGPVVGQVEAPYRIRVQEVVRRCSGDFETYGDVGDCPALETTAHEDFVLLMTGVSVQEGRLLAGLWARVATGTGQQGWILLEVSGIGI